MRYGPSKANYFFLWFCFVHLICCLILGCFFDILLDFLLLELTRAHQIARLQGWSKQKAMQSQTGSLSLSGYAIVTSDACAAHGRIGHMDKQVREGRFQRGTDRVILALAGARNRETLTMRLLKIYAKEV